MYSHGNLTFTATLLRKCWNNVMLCKMHIRALDVRPVNHHSVRLPLQIFQKNSTPDSLNTELKTIYEYFGYLKQTNKQEYSLVNIRILKYTKFYTKENVKKIF